MVNGNSSFQICLKIKRVGATYVLTNGYRKIYCQEMVYGLCKKKNTDSHNLISQTRNQKEFRFTIKLVWKLIYRPLLYLVT